MLDSVSRSNITEIEEKEAKKKSGCCLCVFNKQEFTAIAFDSVSKGLNTLKCICSRTKALSFRGELLESQRGNAKMLLNKLSSSKPRLNVSNYSWPVVVSDRMFTSCNDACSRRSSLADYRPKFMSSN